MSVKKKKKKEQNINDAIFKDAVDDFDRFEDFVSNNLNKIVVVAVIIVVVLIVGYIVYTEIQKKQNKASVALTSAKTITELKEAIKKYPDSVTSKSAKLNLGTQYFKEGKYKEALENYQKLAATALPGEIKNRARLNEAYTLEAMKEPEKAADKFIMIALDATSQTYIRNEANYSAGRIFISLQKPERAEACLKAIKTENQNDFWSSQAKRLLQRVNAKDPVPEEETKKVTTVPLTQAPKQTLTAPAKKADK